jgi:hypothetical protein
LKHNPKKINNMFGAKVGWSKPIKDYKNGTVINTGRLLKKPEKIIKIANPMKMEYQDYFAMQPD